MHRFDKKLVVNPTAAANNLNLFVFTLFSDLFSFFKYLFTQISIKRADK